MSRERDQPALLLDSLYRTVALKVRIRNVRAVAPDVPQWLVRVIRVLIARLAFSIRSVVRGRLQNVDVRKVRVPNADAPHDLRKRRKRVWHPHPCQNQSKIKLELLKNPARLQATLTYSPWYVDHGLNRMPVLFAPTALTTASVTSSTKRMWFSTEPPYESVR